jgi:hypothetical protein
MDYCCTEVLRKESFPSEYHLTNPQKGKCMNIKSLFAASAIALASVSSFAGSTTFANGSATITNDGFDGTGSFTQTITFTGLSAGTYDILGNISGRNLSFTSVALDGESWDITNFTSTNKAKTNFAFGSLEVTGSQPFQLIVTGVNYENAAYIGTISTIPTVPEPESYAMLLAGLGLMGGIARRRANKKQA